MYEGFLVCSAFIREARWDSLAMQSIGNDVDFSTFSCNASMFWRGHLKLVYGACLRTVFSAEIEGVGKRSPCKF